MRESVAFYTYSLSKSFILLKNLALNNFNDLSYLHSVIVKVKKKKRTIAPNVIRQN